MPIGPRIVFMRFLTHESPKLQPWRDHFRRVVGRAPGAPVSTRTAAGDCVVVWHLVTANNRILARSAMLYGGFDEAVTGASSIVSACASLEVVLTSDERQGVYGWYLTFAGEVIASCARWYLTERDRRSSIELALASLATATLATGTRLMHPALKGGVAREPVEV